MSAFSAALLGVVQGLTEFLPVSSSAHLILARELFGVRMSDQLDLAFDVACHVGTLVAVLIFFFGDILAMLKHLPGALRLRAEGDARRLQLMAVGTLPIVVVGALGGAGLEDTLRTPAVAAATLALGAFLLLAAERFGTSSKPDGSWSFRDALLIGVAQAAALVPGVSRSGVTIGVGMLLGYHRRDIARFTFLLSIPAILAAAAKNGLELRQASLSPAELQAFAIAMTTSAIVGYLAIKFFIRFVANHRLDVFAWYRLALAAILLFVLTR